MAVPALLLIIIAILLSILTKGLIFSKTAFPYVSPDFWLTGFIIEQTKTAGWFTSHTYVYGYPFGFSGADFPTADVFNILVIKFFSIFCSDWLAIYKACYLFTFASIPLLTYCALRIWGMQRLFAGIASILFTFIPYHFFRTGHLFLISYHAVPLFLLSCNYISSGASWTKIKKPVLRFTVFLLLQVIIASSGVYYAFFSCLLYLIFAFWIYIIKRQRWAIACIAIAITIITGTALLQTLPERLQKNIQGTNFSVPTRNFNETEISGLKLTQLVLPAMLHRNNFLRKIEQRYTQMAPLVNENRTSALGIIGASGLVASLFFMLTATAFICIPNRRIIKKVSEQLQKSNQDKLKPEIFDELLPLGLLATFNLVCILYSTVGGFGSLFSYLVMPEIRGVNRISIFIALFSIAFLFFYFQRLIRGLPGVKRNLVVILVIACSFVGIWDQTPVLDLSESEKIIEADKLFFNKVIEILPSGSPVFVLPYHPFPEGGRLSRQGDYELLKGALFAPQLRWSAPTFRGRDGDIWYRFMTSISIDRMLKEIKNAGFMGIYLDGNACADDGVAIKTALNELIGSPALYDEASNRSLYAWTSSITSENRASFFAHFSEITSLDLLVKNEFEFNIDMFQDASVPNLLKLRLGDRIILSGWLGAKGLKSRDHIQILFISTEYSYGADALSGLRRDDVLNAIGTTDAYSGFMLYASSDNLERGTYDIYIQYRTDDGALVRSNSNRNILIY